MEIGLLLTVLLIISFVFRIIWAVMESNSKTPGQNTEEPAQYRNYDIDPLVEKYAGFIPYDSYEFAGVKGLERTRLQESREKLLKSLSATPQSGTFHNFLIIPDEMVHAFQTIQFPELRMTPISGAVITLNDGRHYLATVENGNAITSIETCYEGIPFGIEDIHNISYSPHFVTLKIMEERFDRIKNAGYNLAEISGLSPGNY